MQQLHLLNVRHRSVSTVSAALVASSSATRMFIKKYMSVEGSQ